MIERILKPKPKTFYAGTVSAVANDDRRLLVKLESGISVWVEAAGLSPEVGDNVIVAALDGDRARFGIQIVPDFIPGKNVTMVI